MAEYRVGEFYSAPPVIFNREFENSELWKLLPPTAKETERILKTTRLLFYSILAVEINRNTSRGLTVSKICVQEYGSGEVIVLWRDTFQVAYEYLAEKHVFLVLETVKNLDSEIQRGLSRTLNAANEVFDQKVDELSRTVLKSGGDKHLQLMTFFVFVVPLFVRSFAYTNFHHTSAVENVATQVRYYMKWRKMPELREFQNWLLTYSNACTEKSIGKRGKDN